MSTPAGWYDDGSGRLRWWDGELWTEHFAPEEDAGVDSESPAEVSDGAGEDRTVDLTESGPSEQETSDDAESALSSDSGDAPSADGDVPPESESATDADAHADSAVDRASTELSPAASVDSSGGTDAGAPGETDSPSTDADGTDRASADAAPGLDPNSHETPDPTAESVPAAVPESVSGSSAESSLESLPEQPVAPDAPPTPAYPAASGYPASPGYAPGPTTNAGYAHPGSAIPGYGYAPAIGAPGVAGTPYPGGYALGYSASPAAAAPSGPPVAGLIGLGASALGIIFSMVQFLWFFSWFLLVGGLIVSLISLFLRGRKWPGVTGMIVAVVGFVIAAITGVVLLFTSIANYDSYDSDYDYDYDYSTDEPFLDDPAVVEASAGETVSIEQVMGTSEVSVDSATWSAGNGLSDADNGGYLTLTLTWTSIGDDTTFSPSYIEVESPTPSYQDPLTPDQLSSTVVDDGSSITGILVFDVAESDTYTVLIRDELMRPAARITVAP